MAQVYLFSNMGLKAMVGFLVLGSRNFKSPPSISITLLSPFSFLGPLLPPRLEGS